MKEEESARKLSEGRGKRGRKGLVEVLSFPRDDSKGRQES